MVIEIQDNSEQYTEIHYPGGELQLRLMDDTVAKLQKVANGPYEVDLVARIRSSDDIMRLVLLNNAIHAVDPRLHIHCWLPYLPYARADRKFVNGDCFGIEAFGAVINSLEFDSVLTLDVHSSVAFEKIKRLVNVSPAHYIKKAIVDFGSKYVTQQPLTVLFPDQGAAERYNLPAKIESFSIRPIYAVKNRDPESGKLSGFEVPDITGPTIIVDDICDGGGTFMGIAIKAATKHPMGLYVTHGIFSNTLGQLSTAFKEIYCADSYKKMVDNPGFTQFAVKIPG